ncbi:phage portal protein [Fructilactobacillus myrtifloralis]|uniref:Phage portal protein n=1 Tax=Fructilactobacillus myrtifloralis TaxID=2940301 RepID=A0ABY5BPC9_9LACO|nr:phage portal protein [Fructilactobacillus myrtifloralis]USS85075.1 phage portal protein [Fructilactobacillus myrtifloralis]
MGLLNLSNLAKGMTTPQPNIQEDPKQFLNPDLDLFDDAAVASNNFLKNSSLFAILSYITNDLCSGKFIVPNRPQTQNLLQNPSKLTSGSAFWQSMFMNLLANGESFAYRQRSSNQQDYQWIPLRQSQVSTFVLSDASGLVYNITFDEPELGPLRNVSMNDVIHLKLVSNNGGLTGISPLFALGEEMTIQQKSNALTQRALDQGNSVHGVVKENKDGLLNEKEKTLRARKLSKDMRDTGLVVVDSLEDFTPIEMKSDVANLLKQTDWTTDQYCKVYGVPPSLFGGKGDQQSSVDMEADIYSRALNRFKNQIISELEFKLQTKVDLDLRSVTDPDGSKYAKTIADLTQKKAIDSATAMKMLNSNGFVPDEFMNSALKGGDNNGNNDSN